MITVVRTDWFGRADESVTRSLRGKQGSYPISETMEQEDTQHRAGAGRAQQPEPAADSGEEAIAKKIRPFSL